jgi:hypothetical protein
MAGRDRVEYLLEGLPRQRMVAGEVVTGCLLPGSESRSAAVVNMRLSRLNSRLARMACVSCRNVGG